MLGLNFMTDLGTAHKEADISKLGNLFADFPNSKLNTVLCHSVLPFIKVVPNRFQYILEQSFPTLGPQMYWTKTPVSLH